MAQIKINLGTPPSGVDGDPVRTAFEKVNTMFTEVYTGLPTTSAPVPIDRGGTGGKTAAEARENLGLTKVTSNFDVTAGRVLTPGYGGLGGPPVTLPNANDVLSKTGMECFFSGTESTCVAGNYPALGGPGSTVRLWYTRATLADQGTGVQIATEAVGTGTTRGRRFRRVLYSTWGPWVEDVNVTQYGYAANDGADLPGGSWNGIVLSGNYRFSPGNTNGPGTGINYGTVARNAYQISTGTWTEFTQSAQEPRAWLRSSINNTSSNHYEVFTTYNATQDATRDGLMSQTSVGGYLVQKFRNGTMIMSGSPGNTPSVPVNTVFTGQFAIPDVGFVGLTCFITGQPQSSTDAYGCIYSQSASNTVLAYAVRNGAAIAQVFLLRVLIIGQWK